jgi:hypothetical protein
LTRRAGVYEVVFSQKGGSELKSVSHATRIRVVLDSDVILVYAEWGEPGSFVAYRGSPRSTKQV